MDKLLSRSATAMVLALLYFANRGSGTEDTELVFLEIDEFQHAKDIALAIKNVPLDRRNVERRLYFEGQPGSDNRVTKIYVDVGSPAKKFRISLSLMRMACDKTTDNPTYLLITPNGSGATWNTTWCDNVDHGKHDVAEEFTVQGETGYTAEVIGDWSNTNALILATIYYEVDSCNDCDGSSFCCKVDKCAVSTYQARCISKSLKCNGFPNCGMSCGNTDEDRDAYFGFPCGFDMWSLIWMISMAITFFILIPAIVIVLFCYNRQLSRERRNRPHPDVARRRRRNDDVVMHSPPDDLPPTYDDLHDTKEPPPGFSTVISSTSEGIDNPAMVQDVERDSPVHHSAQSKSAFPHPAKMNQKESA